MSNLPEGSPPPPRPDDEEDRLARLQSYAILDTPPENELDDLTRVAALVCGTPIALMSLVDSERQWFKSCVGLDITETPRDVAFCAHAILQRQPLIVPDARVDPRFARNPLVLGDPKICFYAGFPLRTPDGFQLGTLCVIDREPRHLSDTQIETLRSLAHAMSLNLELRHAALSLSRQTEQLKRAEVVQEQARLAAEEANRAKSEFLASMSHELRTPLTSILGLSEALRQGVFGEVNERQEQSVKYIEDSGRHLLSLINDILDLSKIEAGRLEIYQEIIVVEDLCRSSIELTAQSAEKKQIHVSCLVEPSDLAIRTDPRRLKQILFNLLSNAVKFTAEGGRVDLTVAANPDEHSASFTVCDTGIGIAASNLGRLFQPFVQLDSRLTREGQGTGLGLMVVKHLTERLGGSVHVDSDLGKGSQFKIVLPWNSEPAVAASQESVPENGIMGAPQGPVSDSSPLLLIADDSDVSVHIFSEFFTAHGYRIEVARDGRETVERFRQARPDLVLMDIRMPRMNGFEAIRALRNDPDRELARRPILALTALVMPGDRERCLAAGATDYLSKPVRLKELLEIVERSLASASGQRDS